MRKLFVLALMAMALAIAMIQTVQANTIDQNSVMAMTAPTENDVGITENAMLMTSAAPDDIGDVTITENAIFDNMSTAMQSTQSSSANKIGRLDSALEFNSAIKSDQRRFNSVMTITVIEIGNTQTNSCVYSVVSASSNYTVMNNDSATSSGRNFWAMAQGESAAKLGLILKCTQYTEQSRVGFNLIVTANRRTFQTGIRPEVARISRAA
jgi:hypothetical protein